VVLVAEVLVQLHHERARVFAALALGAVGAADGDNAGDALLRVMKG